MKEEWKDIPGYEKLYQVSNKGRVKSLIRWNGSQNRILQPATKKDRHLHVCLYKNKKGKMYLIHTLVLQTFVGLRPYKRECRHLDGNPKNNKLSSFTNWDFYTSNSKGNNSQIMPKKTGNKQLFLSLLLKKCRF